LQGLTFRVGQELMIKAPKKWSQFKNKIICTQEPLFGLYKTTFS